MGKTGANKKVANGLVALSSAAVLAVYSAGYQRTKAAADRFERLAASRRQAMPAAPAASASAPTTPVPAAPSSFPDAAAANGAPPTVAGPQVESLAPPGPAPAPAASVSGPAPVDPAAAPATAPAAAAGPGVTAVTPAVPVTPAAPEPPLGSAAPAETVPAPPLPRGRFVDGTYQGRGSCIHGDIQAQVVVKNGRIVEATISSCETRYSCDWLDPILPQVTARQSAFVDSVSGATDSTDAFSAAVTDALLKAQ